MLLTWLQIAYAIMGGLMNFMSLLHRRNTGRSLTPTPPVAGLMLMLVFASSLTLPYLGEPVLYRITMFVFLVLIGVGGVLKHVAPQDKLAYWSAKSRWCAVLINAYGVVLMAVALVAGLGD